MRWCDTFAATGAGTLSTRESSSVLQTASPDNCDAQYPTRYFATDGRLLPTEARVNPVKAPNGALKLCQAISINFSGQRARKHTRVGGALKRKTERP